MDTTGPPTTGWARIRRDLQFFVVRSLELDRQTMGLRRWSRADRLRFLADKTRALPHLARGGPVDVRAGDLTFHARSGLDLGTLQTCLADVHDDLVAPGILADRPRPVVVDVGANVGQFATAVGCFFPGAQILALEPDPEVHAALAANAADHPGLDTRCAAAGDAPGRLQLYRHEVSVMSTLRPAGVETYDADDTVEVEVVRLDDVTAHLGEVDLLKVDVEGFELEALRGASALLSRTRYLLVELGLDRDQGTNLEVLELVRTAAPAARIVRIGRPLGPAAHPICQDVILQLR